MLCLYYIGTGKASFSAEHKGQLMLYSLMTGDRRRDPESGLLLYVRDGSMQEVRLHFFNLFIPTVPTFAVRQTASLGIMGVPRVPPLNPSG